MVLSRKIERFCAVFDRHAADLEQLAVPEGSRHFKKTLCLSLIEALAAGRYPSAGPKERFVKLVARFGDWTDGDRISVPHLVAALERSDDDRLRAVRAQYYKILKSWGGAPAPRPIQTCDPQWAEVRKEWPAEPEIVPLLGGKLQPTHLRHVELLYDYRNTLVHESREQTASFEEGDDSAPFYESVEIADSRLQEWHLVYPVSFLCRLLRGTLTNYRAHLIDSGRDPYSGYRFGLYVRRELNDPKRFPVVFPYEGVILGPS